MRLNFREATDALLDSVSHETLAKNLGVSVPTVRQARLDPAAKARRSPPEGWESVVFRMAKERAKHFERLAARFKGL
jgi:hypothetical protein